MLNQIVIKELNGQKKIVGEYHTKNNIFTTRRSKNKHLLRKYNAWAIDKKLIETILAPNKASIVIYETTDKVHYKIQADEFLNLASEISFHEHRSQLYVGLDKFVKY